MTVRCRVQSKCLILIYMQTTQRHHQCKLVFRQSKIALGFFLTIDLSIMHYIWNIHVYFGLHCIGSVDDMTSQRSLPTIDEYSAQRSSRSTINFDGRQSEMSTYDRPRRTDHDLSAASSLTSIRTTDDFMSRPKPAPRRRGLCDLLNL